VSLASLSEDAIQQTRSTEQADMPGVERSDRASAGDLRLEPVDSTYALGFSQ
jgi:hypothetical protein